MGGRLSREEEQYFKGLLAGDEHSKPMLFGRFLKLKGLVSEQDIVNARLMQRRQNLLIGEIAHHKGWISEEDIERVLVYQEETPRPFCELAMEHNFLHHSQVTGLLKEMEENHLFLGEALVSLGVISKKEMLDNLEVFSRLRETTAFDE